MTTSVETELEGDAVRPVSCMRGATGPIVAILGRPNVGKSTLFNRLIKVRQAITDDAPGITRDIIHAHTEWNGRTFTLMDTGGYVPDSVGLQGLVREQAQQALDEADLVIFLCDGDAGVTALDREVADMLRRREQPCLLAVNKMDHPEQQRDISEFYSLGLGEPFGVSAATGRHTGDLLDAVVERFDLVETMADSHGGKSIRVVLAGRPNVGKSTLVNRLAGYRVSIVDDRPGTTRDATDIRISWNSRDFTLVDTAGLRRRARIGDQVEYYSVLRATNSIEGADVVIVLLDAGEGETTQDGRIMAHALDSGCAMVVALNKWDLVDAESRDRKSHESALRSRFPFLVDYPVMCISALTGSRVSRCLEAVAQAFDNYSSRVSTSQINRCVDRAAAQLGLAVEGKEVKLLYATQSCVGPPTFVIFSNRPDLVTEAYKRYVKKALRKEFGFAGTPLRILWRRRSRGRPGGQTRFGGKDSQS